ncbi:MAG: MarR family winged helix-turn-helix transcriptional regulator [Actinomycetota bacterium]
MPRHRLSETEMRAWQSLLHAHHDVTTKLEAELQDAHELSMGEYDVLIRLARAPDRALRMSELADRVMLSPSGLTRLVDRLVRKRLVRRVPDPIDGRAALASLTSTGLHAARRAAITHLRGIRNHFTGRLSDSQLARVATALETITGPHEPH